MVNRKSKTHFHWELNALGLVDSTQCDFERTYSHHFFFNVQALFNFSSQGHTQGILPAVQWKGVLRVLIPYNSPKALSWKVTATKGKPWCFKKRSWGTFLLEVSFCHAPLSAQQLTCEAGSLQWDWLSVFYCHLRFWEVWLPTAGHTSSARACPQKVL